MQKGLLGPFNIKLTTVKKFLSIAPKQRAARLIGGSVGMRDSETEGSLLSAVPSTASKPYWPEAYRAPPKELFFVCPDP